MELLYYFDERFLRIMLAFLTGCLIGFLICFITKFIFIGDNNFNIKVWQIKRYKKFIKGILLSDGQFVVYDYLIDSKIDQKIEAIMKEDGFKNFDLTEFLKAHGALYIDSKEIVCSKKLILTVEQQKYLSDNMQYFNEEQKQRINILQRESILYHHVKDLVCDSYVNNLNLMFDRKPDIKVIEAVLNRKEKHGKRKK